ncbi:MAG: hypothetical protein RI894_782 [Bacteroidota bacterium]|jgi:hypothetical protein
MKQTKLLLFFLTLSLLTHAQANLLEKRWKLLEIYQIDTAQRFIKAEELNFEKHREQQVFHCHEMGLEYQALFFTHDSLCYRLEHKLSNESKLYNPQRYILMNKQTNLIFSGNKEISFVLLLSPTMLILGRQKNLIEVYIPLDANEDELKLPSDYIWQYYKAFLPHKFRRYEEGVQE